MKKKCLVIHSNLYDFGGAEIFAVRAINTLTRLGFDVDLLHCGKEIDAQAIKNWSAISIDEKKMKVIKAFPFFQKIIKNRKLSLLRYALALRAARTRAHEYDMVLSTYGELTVKGKINFQFIHVPLFFYDAESLSYLGENSDNWKKNILRKIYVKASRYLSGWNRQDVATIPALANSKWTMNQAARHYPEIPVGYSYIGANTENVYAEEVIGDWWTDRSDTIVVLGRVVPGKRIEFAIEFSEQLRKRGIDIKLLIIGRADLKYGEEIKALIQNNEHIQWKQGLSRIQLESEIASCKWGLHCALFEHYGISALEIQRLGCLTLVPDSCGQAELVDDPSFSYKNMNDLVDKFSRIYFDHDLQVHLNHHRVQKILEHKVERHDQYLYEYFHRLENVSVIGEP